MTTPLKITLEKDKKHAYCTCNLSGIKPFCDGSHRGTEFKPIKFYVEETKEDSICKCQKTKTPPFCDCSHKRIN